MNRLGRWVSAMRMRFHCLLQRKKIEQELDDELQFHLQRQIEEYTAQGVSGEEARFAAARALGSLQQRKDECRDMRRLNWIDHLIQDLGYAVRTLRRSPGFTATVVLTLALGIGANTTIFSLINAILIRPMPFKDPGRLVLIWHKWKTIDAPFGAVSAPSFVIYRDEAKSFDHVAVVKGWSVNLTGEGEPEQIQGFLASAEFFPVLGVKPVYGRLFQESEDKPGANQVVVIADSLWKRRFGSDPNIVGKAVTLDGSIYRVLGVMPAGVELPREVEMWAPIGFSAEDLSERNHGNENYVAVGRLKKGISIQQAQAEMDGLTLAVRQRFPKAYPDASGWAIRVSSLENLLVGNFRLALLVLCGAVGFVLLIACVNVANLLLARATARHKEIAVRMSIGANRTRIIRQMLTEGLLLSVLAGTFGVLLAFSSAVIIRNTVPTEVTHFQANWNRVGIDYNVFAFTCILSLLTAVIFGLAPAIQASRIEVNGSLKETRGTTHNGTGRNGGRGFLVTSEIVLVLVLLVGSGLLIRSFIRLQAVNAGFRTQNVLTMRTSLPKARYGTNAQRASFYQRSLQQIEAIPGVDSAGVISQLPLARSGESYGSFHIQGFSLGKEELPPHGAYRIASPDYFRALGIPLIRGRFFTEQDTATSNPVAIIDDEIARRYWPNGDPIGKHLAFYAERDGKEPFWREIVGVVGHVQHLGLDVESKMQYYMPSLQYEPSGQQNMFFVVRSIYGPQSLIPAIRNVVRQLDQDVPIYRTKSMDEVVSDSLAERRFSMILLTIFAAVALILTFVGIYGLIAYSVCQRRHEIGIRIAIGASQSAVLRLLVGRALKLSAIGISIGAGLSLALTRVMTGLLYDVSVTDPLTFAGVGVLLAGVAILAAYLPARTACRIDPMVALRYD